MPTCSSIWSTPTELDKHTRDLLVGLESAPLNNRGRTYADVARAMVVAQERLELASLVQEYQALKLRLGLVEFADQMAIAARLAVSAPPVSGTLRSSFAVVLLDEYQDTSAAQAMMLRGLFSGSTPSEGLGHPVTAVGDPLQAIYGWRGAAASNILTFAETFRRRDGRPAAELRPHRQPAQRPVHPGRGQPAQPAAARAGGRACRGGGPAGAARRGADRPDPRRHLRDLGRGGDLDRRPGAGRARPPVRPGAGPTSPC